MLELLRMEGKKESGKGMERKDEGEGKEGEGRTEDR
jgi:hypothetical protein